MKELNMQKKYLKHKKVNYLQEEIIKISDKKYNFFMYKIISAIKKKRARSPLLNMCLN